MATINFAEIASKLSNTTHKDWPIEEWMNKFHEDIVALACHSTVYSIEEVDKHMKDRSYQAKPDEASSRQNQEMFVTRAVLDILSFLSIAAPASVFSDMQTLYDKRAYAQKTNLKETALSWHHHISVAYAGLGGNGLYNMRNSYLTHTVVWMLHWAETEGFDMAVALAREFEPIDLDVDGVILTDVPDDAPKGEADAHTEDDKPAENSEPAGEGPNT